MRLAPGPKQRPSALSAIWHSESWSGDGGRHQRYAA